MYLWSYLRKQTVANIFRLLVIQVREDGNVRADTIRIQSSPASSRIQPRY